MKIIANTELYYDYVINMYSNSIYIGFFEIDTSPSPFYDRQSSGKEGVKMRAGFGQYYYDHPYATLCYNVRWYEFPACNLSLSDDPNTDFFELAIDYINIVIRNKLQPNAKYQLTYNLRKYTRDKIIDAIPTPQAIEELHRRINNARADLLQNMKDPRSHCI